MGRFSGNTCRLIVMMLLVFTYFVVELVIGHVISAVSLIADSFHMLSDLVALAVGVAAIRISKWPRSSKNTFGWQRAEVVGSLVNTVILVTLCFTIVIEAIQKFVKPEEIGNPKLMLGVGAGGLLINILGLIILGANHGHSHGHEVEVTIDQDEEEQLIVHNPSNNDLPLPANGLSIEPDSSEPEGTSDTGLTTVKMARVMETAAAGVEEDLHSRDGSGQRNTHVENGSVKGRHKHGHGHGHGHGSSSRGVGKPGRMNMRAVFLHVLADFFGSVIVVSCALIIWLAPGNIKTDGHWKQYIDPGMSIVMVVIICSSAVPLLYKAALILLQSVPKDVCVKNLKSRLEKIDGIHRVHDLHVWRLQSQCIIGTVHIRCRNLREYVEISRKVKELFHDFNIHCTTIQPEFEEHVDAPPEGGDYQQCLLMCGSGTNKTCPQRDACCPTTVTNGAAGATVGTVQTPSDECSCSDPTSSDAVTHDGCSPQRHLRHRQQAALLCPLSEVDRDSRV